MRFVSQHEGYGAQIRVQRQRAIDGGGTEVLQPGLYVKFTPVNAGGMLYENERRTALEHFVFRGQTQDIGEAIPTDPVQRLSVFDTDEAAILEGWSPADKALVEEKLSILALTTPQEVILVADTPINAPFPNYDVFDGTPTELVVKLVEDGHDLEVVLAYESIFGQKRPEIIEALQMGIEVGKEEIITA
jgi:hypothetical protein